MRTQPQSFLPSIKRNYSQMGSMMTHLPEQKLHRIQYPPIQNKVFKENRQSLMLQSCFSNNQYEDLLDHKNEEKITCNLYPSEASSTKELDTLNNYIGKEGSIKYYQKYKTLTRTLQKRDLNRHSEISNLSFQNPVVSLLQKAQKLQIMPLTLGLVKAKGQIGVLNVSDYNLGDRYIMALAAGLKKARNMEKMYLSGNRITDISLADLADSVSQEVTVLELSRNKITILDKKILEMIIEPQFRLQTLGIANNFLKVSSADAIFKNSRYSRHIRRLDLRHNKLGSGCLDSLAELIQKTQTLEQLYIGGNNLSSRSGQKIFNNLKSNKTIRIFDYSFNKLGDDGNSTIAQSISNCLQNNRTLHHLDLSFNNFTKQASQIIANGLEPNKSLYGIHFRGNYGFINSKGFLIIAERQGTVLHSVDTFKMDAYDITSPREQNSMESHLYRDVCWICEGWYEQEFKLSLPKSETQTLVFIHFDFEKYQPRLISLTDHVKYKTMVPPKKYRYFFTVNGQIYLDSHFLKESLPLSQTHTYEMNHQETTFTVNEVNHRRGKPKKIVNQWLEVIIQTLPRNTGLTIKREKEPWKFEKSVWAKEYKLENQELLQKCFERDWKSSKLTTLIKSQTDQDKVKQILWKSYSPIKNIYRYYSSWNPVGQTWAVSSNPFTQFCSQSKITSKDTPLKIIDLTFITTNSMSGANFKGNCLVPQRGLVRFQFMQSLVRLADEKFKKLGITDNYADSTEMMLKEHVLPLLQNYDFQIWRTQKYFNEFNDALIKKYRFIFSAIYKRNSKLKVKPGEKPYMCLPEFKSIFDKMGLTTNIAERDIFIAFNNAMMTHADQLETDKFLRMTQIQFIQALARCASGLPSSCSLEVSGNPPLHMKFQWLTQQLLKICPEETKNQLTEIQKSIFREEEQLQ